MRKVILLFSIQVVLYCVITFNYRAIAKGDYLWTILSDLVIATLTFLSFNEIAKGTDRIEKCIGFTAGSVCGSIVGIFLSKIVLKQ